MSIRSIGRIRLLTRTENEGLQRNEQANLVLGIIVVGRRPRTCFIRLFDDISFASVVSVARPG